MKNLTQGNELKQITLFSLPMLLGNIFQQLYNVVDSIVVGKNIGDHALAAVGISFPVWFIFISLVIGFTMACNILIAQFVGAKKHEEIDRVIQTSILILFWAGLIVTVIGIFFAPYILKMMNTPSDVFEEALIYLRLIFSGMIFLFIYNAFNSMLRGFGDSMTPLYALIISTIINIGLDCLFVIAFKWGIAGAAIATVIAQFVSCLWLILYSRKKYEAFRLNFFKLRFDKLICVQSVKMGFPSGIQQALVGGGFMALLSIVNTFGTQTAAAYSAAGKLDGFIVMPALNIGVALSSFTGQNIGAGKLDRVKRGLHASLLLGLGITVTATTAIVIFGKSVMHLFVNNPEVIALGARYLIIVAPAYFFNTITFTLNGVVRGAGETVFPMISTLMAMWVFRVPAAALLSRYLGSDGIWLAVSIGSAAGCLLTFIYYCSGKWKKKAAKILDAKK
ncbi:MULTISPECIES: MATE family efflux transporter [unclassified Treponema]|uniref:MATE family efflux transporter n=1 Tax=unclassified Treponema TaxID=2638727 RepID=UPI0020A2C6C7|nr:MULTISPECIES: MATE family efflux transporter [unclassified Treponema]UTC66288.1 MATE family efflux transporter [Treponema sp. OMZ 789]UTC69018.1 MATE family efflux transporter [Treponema sp. OMZ 790]UTC71730.1 MATE family efflux transporter [Treponema sp. OMZ 791]